MAESRHISLASKKIKVKCKKKNSEITKENHKTQISDVIGLRERQNQKDRRRKEKK